MRLSQGGLGGENWYSLENAPTRTDKKRVRKVHRPSSFLNTPTVDAREMATMLQQQRADPRDTATCGQYDFDETLAQQPLRALKAFQQSTLSALGMSHGMTTKHLFKDHRDLGQIYESLTQNLKECNEEVSPIERISGQMQAYESAMEDLNVVIQKQSLPFAILIDTLWRGMRYCATAERNETVLKLEKEIERIKVDTQVAKDSAKIAGHVRRAASVLDDVNRRREEDNMEIYKLEERLEEEIRDQGRLRQEIQRLTQEVQLAERRGRDRYDHVHEEYEELQKRMKEQNEFVSSVLSARQDMESKFGALLDSLGRLLDIDKMSAKSFVKADDEIRKAYVDALQAKYHSREAEKR
mmetsp:Transcript_36805/g.95302  ORF Transcript_36805/g.95302 Transcript_36805/m.95302 type:complete len:354 (+) Transcript_36805:131-1192(+)